MKIKLSYHFCKLSDIIVAKSSFLVPKNNQESRQINLIEEKQWQQPFHYKTLEISALLPTSTPVKQPPLRVFCTVLA